MKNNPQTLSWNEGGADLSNQHLLGHVRHFTKRTEHAHAFMHSLCLQIIPLTNQFKPWREEIPGCPPKRLKRGSMWNKTSASVQPPGRNSFSQHVKWQVRHSPDRTMQRTSRVCKVAFSLKRLFQFYGCRTAFTKARRKSSLPGRLEYLARLWPPRTAYRHPKSPDCL